MNLLKKKLLDLKTTKLTRKNLPDLFNSLSQAPVSSMFESHISIPTYKINIILMSLTFELI